MSSTSQVTDFSDLIAGPPVVQIYGLCDPSSEQLRYVGKSINPTVRRYEHVCASQLHRKSHKNNWIKSLLAKGEKPEMFIIETVPESQWASAERFWIAYFRSIGVDLTNSTDGGDGQHNFPPEVRKKIGDASRGKKRQFTAEHIAKIADGVRARMRTPRGLAKAQATALAITYKPGHRWTEEQKAAARESAKRREGLYDRATLSRAAVVARFKKHMREIVCAGCGVHFTAVDLKAKFCGGTCKQRVHRAKQKGVHVLN